MARIFLVVSSLLAILGCAGLAGYGDEVGSSAVASGRAFEIKAEAPVGEPLDVWLEYAVEHPGRGWSVDGTVAVEAKYGTQRSWPVHVTESGAPVDGGGRTSLYPKSVDVNGKGSRSETLYLLALPAMPAGTRFRVHGTLAPSSGATLTAARLVVTE